MTYQIPLVDLDAALGDSAPAEVLDEVRAAVEQFGVVQVVHHGVDPGLIDEFSRHAGDLLARPRAEKAGLASPTGHPYRGWRQWPDDFGRLELERFNVAQFDTPEDAKAAGVPEKYLGLYAHANVWPPDDPGLREVTFRYIEASRRLAERMLGLYARAVGAPAGTFSLGSLPHLRLTVNDYPTWSYPDTADPGDSAAGSDEDKLLLLEHADDSALTVLSQAGDYEGLQVQMPDGAWRPVPIVPGALQVFSGMLLTRWSNGRLRPGRHRVVAGGTVTRRSTAVFCYPSLETVVEPLAPFVGPEGPSEQPVLVWDHVEARVESYLEEFGRPEQVTAWREGRSYVAPLAETSAGR
ncbi:MAG TPA: 2OG-Fe(II) oxygenase family protein [Streptosporangiaceae bacterium]|jgi:isopenicillin N synthase-like dioxygenase|nr:2OG-Fe(II) oxygenase family protein [Streptosporangiaceae bacterium]